MKDPSGTDIEVPILGVGRAKTRGGLRPLGGTLEDPEGQGQCTDTVAIWLSLPSTSYSYCYIAWNISYACLK